MERAQVDSRLRKYPKSWKLTRKVDLPEHDSSNHTKYLVVERAGKDGATTCTQTKTPRRNPRRRRTTTKLCERKGGTSETSWHARNHTLVALEHSERQEESHAGKSRCKHDVSSTRTDIWSEGPREGRNDDAHTKKYSQETHEDEEEKQCTASAKAA